MRKTIALLLLFACCAQAADKDSKGKDKDAVYRYTDAHGVVHYTDKPPTKDATPAVLPALQTFKSTGSSPLLPAQANGAPVDYTLVINSPQPDETLRDNTDTLTVSVAVQPPLDGGYGLVYTVDGKAQNDTPVTDQNFAVGGLQRGSHTIRVDVIDTNGKSVASSSVEVHSKPPVAKAH